MLNAHRLSPGQTGSHSAASQRRWPAWPTFAAKFALLLAGTVFAVLLLGYHPYAEDGGIYAAAVQARLHPDLFAHDRVWVAAHTRFALFVPLVVAIVRISDASPAVVLFTLYAAGLLALLAAAAHLAQTCFPRQRRPWLTVLWTACAAGLPVAGTSLYAVDPYCTARSLTTPLLLFALSLALRRRWSPAALCWAAAAALHPLMAIWGALPLLFLICLHVRHRRRGMLVLSVAVLLAAALLFAISPVETDGAREAGFTRAYWFPFEWRWFEWVGAIAPCVLLGVIARRSKLDRESALQSLAISAAATSALCVVVALMFAREGASSLAVARLQPLRALHLVFVAFLVAVAAFLQSRLRSRAAAVAAILACLAMAASTYAMQRSLYPHTTPLEWPGAAPTNSWEEAFAWCRDHTPPSALFALDAGYNARPGEDSHGFRAIALRSALPDRSKDAGVAAVLPGLAPAWQTGVGATAGLNGMTDAERIARLQPLGVTWIVLPASTGTALPCPFHNGAVQVCRLPSSAGH